MSFRNRNFRKKASDDHASEEALGRDEEEAGAGFPTAAGRKDEKDKKKDKKKDKNSKSASGLLSFEEEAEDDAPALKLKKKLPKSSNKAKLAATVPPPSKPTEKGTQHSAPGEYTAEKLRALQKNAINISTARLAPPPQPDDGESPAHPLIKLSGSFKPAGSVAPRSPVYSPERQVMHFRACLCTRAHVNSSRGIGQQVPDATVAREVDVEEEMPLPPPPRQSSGSAAGGMTEPAMLRGDSLSVSSSKPLCCVQGEQNQRAEKLPRRRAENARPPLRMQLCPPPLMIRRRRTKMTSSQMLRPSGLPVSLPGLPLLAKLVEMDPALPPQQSEREEGAPAAGTRRGRLHLRA